MASRSAFLAIPLFSLALAGCVSSTPLHESRPIPPDAFFEVNFDMEAGDTVAWTWTTSAPVRFDLHTHFDGELQVHRNATAAEGTGSYTAERTGTHSLLWKNVAGSQVDLEFTLDGAFRLDSFYPA